MFGRPWFLLLLCFPVNGRARECRFESVPRVLFREGASSVLGGKLLQVWDERDDPVFSSRQLPHSASLNAFLKVARSKAGDVSQASLLKKAIEQNPGKGDQKNANLVYQERRKWVRPAGCLESLLFSQQTDRLDMASQPTELTAFVLKAKYGRRIRIYYYTVNQAGIGGMGTLTAPVLADLATGQWRPWMSLHNHNFFFTGPVLGGTVAPSEADAQFFQSAASDFVLETAWITNGFDTLKLGRRHFRRLSAAP